MRQCVDFPIVADVQIMMNIVRISPQEIRIFVQLRQSIPMRSVRIRLVDGKQIPIRE